MQKDRSTAASSTGKRPTAQIATQWVLAMPAGHFPDWEAASSYVESMTSEELDDLATDCAAALGQSAAPGAAELRERLRDALQKLAAAMYGHAACERLVTGRAEVLTEPGEPGSRTALVCAIELLDCGGALDILGCKKTIYEPSGKALGRADAREA